jgi:iron complex transport system substrate-binding protein
MRASPFRPIALSALVVLLPTAALPGLAAPLAGAEPAEATALPRAARAQPEGFPFTITDDAGVSSTFTAPPERVVSLSPGLTEITFALGAGSRLVAVDTYSNFPPQAKSVEPRLTTYPSPPIETIVSLTPDVVLSLADRDEDLTLIRRQGVRVLKLFPRDFDATLQAIEMLGRLYGSPDAGQAITTDMSARRDAVVAAVAEAPRPRVYEELDASEPDKPFVAGPNGFYGQLIDLAGGTNIFGDLPGDVGQIGAESIVQRDPEVIVLTDADVPFNPQTPEMVAARPGWAVITAVQTGAIYAVPGSLYSTPGPRLVQGLEELARLLHPDRFAPAAGGARRVAVSSVGVASAATRPLESGSAVAGAAASGAGAGAASR